MTGSNRWLAFVAFQKPGERRYFDRAKDQVLKVPESTDQPTLPEIVPFTKEEQLNWRREFAERIEPGNPLKEKLLHSLCTPSPLHEFSSCLRLEPAAQNSWYRFLSQKVRAGIEDWAKKNGLGPEVQLEHEAAVDSAENERRKLYSVLDKIPVNLLLDLTVPLRWSVQGKEQE
ncbi:MAG TPA: hypothetical protein VGW33_12015 [Terriglobia bacterium]|nr:hypothetical protein [Terriglobia bacterium]